MIPRRILHCGAILLLAALLLSLGPSCSPSPTDEQILQAVRASNEAEGEPLELVWEELAVPHRYSGRAHAVLRVPDGSTQRNFIIVYDRKTRVFLVESYITLLLGEDGVYRENKDTVPNPQSTRPVSELRCQAPKFTHGGGRSLN